MNDEDDELPNFDDDPLNVPEDLGKTTAFKKRKGTPVGGDESDEGDDVEMPDLGSTTEEEDEEEDEYEHTPRPCVPDPSCPSSPSLNIIARNGDGESDTVKLAGGAWVTNYDYRRLVKIGENKQLMRSLGIVASAEALANSIPAPRKTAKRQTHAPGQPGKPPRRVLPARITKVQPKK